MPARYGVGDVTSSTSLAEIAMAYFPSRVLCAAARLGIADVLGDTNKSTEEIAAGCRADSPSMYRLLRAMAAMGLVEETEPGHFRLAERGRPLRKDAADSAWPSIVFWADLLADFWSQLGECVRTGQTAARVMENAGIASRWSKDPDANSMFRAVMGTKEDYTPIATAWEFPERGVVADLGGGGGALIRAVLEARPLLQGMLVDRDDSIAGARQHFKDSGVLERCTMTAADLCQNVPAGADVYVLKWVLHGYTDEKALSILRNCRAVTPPEGRLLIIEFVLPDAVSQPMPELVGRFMSDLNMMAVTGGCERSEREWRHLLERASFTLARNIPVPVLDVSILEARPANVMAHTVGVV